MPPRRLGISEGAVRLPPPAVVSGIWTDWRSTQTVNGGRYDEEIFYLIEVLSR